MVKKARYYSNQEFVISIGQRIKELRKEHNHSQEYLIEKVRLSINCYETGTKVPTLMSIYKICEFYKTTIYGGEGIVSVFEFDKDGAFADKKLSIKEFATPNEEWALFVMGNRDRNSEHPTHHFDIVIGPVADDEMATQFRYFKDGIIDLEKLVSKIRFHKVSSQYFFHTDRAIKYLKPYE